MTRASSFARLFAFVVDLFFLLIVHLFLFAAAGAGHALWGESASSSLLSAGLVNFTPVLTLASVFVVLYYFTSLSADGEQTIGKSMFGIRVVTRDGENMGRVRACTRCICYWFSAFPFFLGFLMAFVFKGHALHDILCRTMVIKVRDDW
jgi:uncharacterized RDD family membrane protein YckC